MDATAFRAALDAGDPILLDGGLATQLEAQGADLSDRLWSARLLVERPGRDRRRAPGLLPGRRPGRDDGQLPGHVRGLRGARDRPRRRAEALLRRSVELADAGARAGGRRGPRPRAARRSAVRRRVHRARTARCSPTAPSTAAGTAAPWRSCATSTGSASASSRRPAPTSWPWRRSRRSRRRAPSPTLLAELPGRRGLDQLLVRRRRPPAQRRARRGGAWPRSTATPGRAWRSASTAPRPEHVDELVGRIRAVTSLPIVVYPNSGEGWDAVARRWTGTGAASAWTATRRVRWRAAGAPARSAAAAA